LNGSTLAAYRRDAQSGACPKPKPDSAVVGTWQDLTVSQPVKVQDRRVGTFVMLYDLGEIYRGMLQSGLTVFIVLLISSAIAFLVSASLRNRIVLPILHLLEVTSSVTKTRDYGIRVERLSRDEVGVLADTFNEMLSGIQSRDQELRESLAAQRTALDNLARSNADLNRSNEDLERFAFIASHDLREPLRSISLNSQLLMAQLPGQLNERATNYAARVREGTERMQALLTSLLSYTELVGVAPSAADEVDANGVMTEVVQNLQVLIQETNAKVTWEPLPRLQVQEAHLVSLLQNLIGNSLKYRSERPPEIHLSVAQDNNGIQFALRDNGIGINPDYHSKIFVAFKRLHGRSIPGTGIGLALCLRIVTCYGGRIWVESTLGHGATFYFTLPAANGDPKVL
jgi:signal transduction histidine kinase